MGEILFKLQAIQALRKLVGPDLPDLHLLDAKEFIEGKGALPGVGMEYQAACIIRDLVLKISTYVQEQWVPRHEVEEIKAEHRRDIESIIESIRESHQEQLDDINAEKGDFNPDLDILINAIRKDDEVPDWIRRLADKLDLD